MAHNLLKHSEFKSIAIPEFPPRDLVFFTTPKGGNHLEISFFCISAVFGLITMKIELQVY